MADVSITYKGSEIANMSASGAKTVKTSGKYCEGDITVSYTRPSGYPEPTGTINITSNGTHNVKDYASANVNVPSQSPTIQPLSVTANGTYTAPSGVDGYSPVTVNVPSSGGKACYVYDGYKSTATSSYAASGVKVTVEKTGTYNVSWTGARNTTSGTSGTQLHVGSTTKTAHTSFTDSYWQYCQETNVSITAGTVVEVYSRARSTSYKMDVGNLIVQEV